MGFNHTRNIVIGGEAGQGLVTVGGLLTKVLVHQGYNIVVSQSYESRIRGGHNTYTLRVSSNPIYATQDSIDILIALNADTIQLHTSELSPNGIIIADASHEIKEDLCKKRCLKIPYKELASPKVENIVALGVIISLLGINENDVSSILEQTFKKKGEAVIEENKKALHSALDWTQKQNISFEKLPSINDAPFRLAMNGNDAIALGALSAGIKFYSFYPMTPSTSIGLNLAAAAKMAGVVVEQAEDEIAAINMALGASFAGAPSMVATSGGGFALMVEGVSLAGMTETPIVIVLGQRPAPATGLPTRTEQADLEFVLYSGHGEFPRAVFAPGSVEECFHSTRKAFELADKYQSPVFILTDQFLADSYRAVKPFEIENLAPVKIENLEAPSPYHRYAFTDSGVSPRLIPGLSKNFVVADSDEHTEDGHITEDLSIRKKMVEKRLKKLEGIKKEVLAPHYEGDPNPDLLFIAWGSNKGAVIETLQKLKTSGKKCALLHFAQVWPLVPENFLPYLEKAKEVISIEGNATGQFANLIRKETGFEIKKRILRYDGLPITPEFIFNKLNA